MKPKHYISILIAIIAIFLAIFLSGCTGKTVSGIRMKNEDIVEVKSGNIDLDNIPTDDKKLFISLHKDSSKPSAVFMTPSKSKNILLFNIKNHLYILLI